ncbi:hypothetical protein DSO57_1035765 [Entomophthora muscae]|uniref:Uncharacterized protein n=1 Tax=Entomophthora muscae TaxID=34485 RepID=A0ACC2T014_9FUNG|nr:hypothetical protein DSO57_1035765 [Entomophthora muscae]
MDLPLVVLWELFDYLEKDDLVSLGSANKELRYVVAPVLFSHMHINHNNIDSFNAAISKKYNTLCTSLSINYKFLHYTYSSNSVNLFDNLINVHSLTLQGYAAPWKDSPAMLKKPSKIKQLSLYDTRQAISPNFHMLTSLFIYRNGGISSDMLTLDSPLQKLSFNLDAPDTDIMQQAQLRYPHLENISIFTRYDCKDFPIICYNFKNNQTLGLGWKKDEHFFSLDFCQEDVIETQLAPTETIGDLYTRMLALLSQKETMIMKHSLPIIKMFSLANYSSELVIDYPFFVLMQHAESIYLGAQYLKKSPLRSMVYSTTHIHLNNIDGTYHLDVDWLSAGTFDKLQVLSIYQLSRPFQCEFKFPELRSFSVKFISRPNLGKMIRAAPLLATVYCTLAEASLVRLAAEYPRIQIKRYKDSYQPYLSYKESTASTFDQNV